MSVIKTIFLNLKHVLYYKIIIIFNKNFFFHNYKPSNCYYIVMLYFNYILLINYFISFIFCDNFNFGCINCPTGNGITDTIIKNIFEKYMLSDQITITSQILTISNDVIDSNSINTAINTFKNNNINVIFGYIQKYDLEEFNQKLYENKMYFWNAREINNECYSNIFFSINKCYSIVRCI